MKFLIIEFSCFNGIRTLHATHYYVNGKRVTQSTFYSEDHYVNSRKDLYEYKSSRFWHDKNKNGCDRDYTEIIFSEKVSA